MSKIKKRRVRRHLAFHNQKTTYFLQIDSSVALQIKQATTAKRCIFLSTYKSDDQLRSAEPAFINIFVHEVALSKAGKGSLECPYSVVSWQKM